MSEILTVQEFNQKQTAKYREAVKNWKIGQGGFPFLGAYIFDKKRGFVLCDDCSYLWFKTKKEAVDHQAQKPNELHKDVIFDYVEEH